MSVFCFLIIDSINIKKKSFVAARVSNLLYKMCIDKLGVAMMVLNCRGLNPRST